MAPYGNASYQYPYDYGPPRSRWLGALSALNLLVILALAGLQVYLSEDWWASMVLVYLPKVPFILPASLLLIWSVFARSKWFLANLASLVVVAWPMMGLVVPVNRLTAETPLAEPGDLRVVSCNIQAFQPSFPLVAAELLKYQPDIVAFQEVRGDDHPLLAKAFDGWHVVREDYFWVGSKYPVRLIRTLDSPGFDRIAGLLVEVELPTGPIQVANIHLMTARRSLAELTPGGMFNGENQQTIEEHQMLREKEMQEIREQIDDHRAGQPRILLGDFNTPSSSSLFQRWWGDYLSAFDQAGLGYGYTSPCRQHTHWLSNTPWVRIDHVLCSPDWDVLSCEIGVEAGSDHRLITASLRPRGFAVRPMTDDAGINDRAEATQPDDSPTFNP